MKSEIKYSAVENFIMRLLATWSLTGLLLSLNNRNLLTSLDFVKTIQITDFIILFITCFCGFSILQILCRNIHFDAVVMLVFLSGYIMNSLYKSNNLYLAIGLGTFLLFAIAYVLNKYRFQLHHAYINKSSMLIIIILFGLYWFIFVGGLTTLRLLGFHAPCFDFGIFSQMFYYMKKDFQPLTTCERDGLLTHFSVHVSPIFYLILPVYYVLPYSVTLVVLQALVVFSGIIPLYLLCKKFELSHLMTLGIGIIYFTYPSIMGGCFYDIHENIFLLPLVLWLFYAIEKKKNLFIVLITILVLMVKEDAAIYTACIGLYLFCSRREKKKGILMLFGSVVYFGAVYYYLSHYGTGAMVGRYDNYMATPAAGLVGMVETLIKNPIYLFSEVFTIEKMEFMAYMLLPLLFMPFITKKITDYLLFIPFLVINLMSDNQYQHSIFFQYTFGVSAIFLYMTVKNLSGRETVKKKKHIIFMVVISILLNMTAITVKMEYIKDYQNNRSVYQKVSELLSDIPEDASVEASAFYVVPLSKRDEIYEYGTTHKCDYIVYDLRYNKEELLVKMKQKQQEGYELTAQIENQLAILKK